MTTVATRSRIAGLDGLRGLAVALVLVYHLWPWLLPGGYLGVTLFFALSGFLMVRLLRGERERTGRIDLRSYYGRRIRRLLPLSLGVAAVVAVVWSLSGWMTADLRRELRFTVVQLANWGQLSSGQRYGVTDEPSPVVHYWSLAIEEQVYVLLPLVVLLVRGRRTLVAALVLGLAVSVVATVLSAGDAVVVYYSTFTRMGEVLVGALVALAPLDRVRRAAPTLAAGGLLALVVMTRNWPVGHEAVHRGGLLAAGAIAATVVGAVSVTPQFGALLDLRPLAWLGTVSYGVYLIHWPLLVGLDATSLPRWAVPGVTLVATLALAAASARWFERPLQRAGRARAARPGFLAGGLASAATIGLALPMLVSVPPTVPDFEAAIAEFEAAVAARPATDMPRPGPTTAPTTTAVVTPTTAASTIVPTPPAGITIPDSIVPDTAVPAFDTEPVGALVYGYFGDSKALALALGAARRPPVDWALGPSLVRLGCPLGRGGDGRAGPDAAVLEHDHCDWTGFADADEYDDGPIDVAVVWFGTWDVLERQVPALGPGWWSLDDPAYRLWLLDEWEALVAGVVEAFDAQLVLILTLPQPLGDPPTGRVTAWNRLLDRFAADTELPVEVLDIAGWVAASGEAERLLPDGVHATFDEGDGPNTGAELHERFIAPRAELAWRQSVSR